MKPYQAIAIQDCGEPLVAIPLRNAPDPWGREPNLPFQGERLTPLGQAGIDPLMAVIPHPYQSLGAPYGPCSPFSLRSGVLAALLQAQGLLQQQQPGWGLQVFDAYRPLAVQRFMVQYTFQTLVRDRGLHPEALAPAHHRAIMAEVEQFWASPSDCPDTPPPHSTGAAVDLTLVDDRGQPVAMGSAIDEISPRSFPDHFSQSHHPQAELFNYHRQLLHQVMVAAGFRRHLQEWWHFCLGDQMWTWLVSLEQGQPAGVARYGRVETRSDSLTDQD
ncbi:MAG: D-alanyl-D-alanine dipeptidase [Cyanobacteria bacterium REEB459]|nr:D-alanyl-D-alanine dipeptidase [Cyanobacteria bacterium REEB459]